MNALDWTVYVLGALAILALWVIPSRHLKSGLAGVIFLVISLFCAYFGVGTWHTGISAFIGVICLVAFWFGDRPQGRRDA